MASTFENFSNIATSFPSVITAEPRTFRQVYEQNRQRIYSLSFWMTDNELIAEQLLERTFRRAFRAVRKPSAGALDRALLCELRELMPLGKLSLRSPVCAEVANVRRNTLRVHLERAVVQLPPTEKMVFLMHDVEGYGRARIAGYLGMSCEQVQQGLHQARLRLRQLLAASSS